MGVPSHGSGVRFSQRGVGSACSGTGVGTGVPSSVCLPGWGPSTSGSSGRVGAGVWEPREYPSGKGGRVACSFAAKPGQISSESSASRAQMIRLCIGYTSPFVSLPYAVFPKTVFQTNGWERISRFSAKIVRARSAMAAQRCCLLRIRFSKGAIIPKVTFMGWKSLPAYSAT